MKKNCSSRRKQAALLLGIPPHSPKPDIEKKFRKLAKKYHPDRKNGNEERFVELQRAKDILLNNYESDDSSNSSEAINHFHHPLSVTLDDLYNGRSSNIAISRAVINPDNVSTSQVKDILKVVVKPGTFHRDQIIFKEMSDEIPGESITGDIIFHVKELPHESFLRSGDDLLHITNIELIDALVGNQQDVKQKQEKQETQEKPRHEVSYMIDHMDGRTLKCRMPVPPRNALEAFRIIGEGMPRKVDDDKGIKDQVFFGDLYLVRTINFPSYVSTEQINIIKMVLGGENKTSGGVRGGNNGGEHNIEHSNEKDNEDNYEQTEKKEESSDDDKWIALQSSSGIEFFEHQSTGISSTSKLKSSKSSHKKNCSQSTLGEQEKVHVRRCVLKDYYDFQHSFPEFAKYAQIHSLHEFVDEFVGETVSKNVGRNVDDKICSVSSSEQILPPTKSGTKSRRWSIDEDYGIDDDALDDEENKCETQ